MPLSVLLEIPNQRLQAFEIISGVSQCRIAPMTEKPSNLTRSVAVVNMKGSTPSRMIGPTDFASTVLGLKHLVKLLQGDSI